MIVSIYIHLILIRTENLFNDVKLFDDMIHMNFLRLSIGMKESESERNRSICMNDAHKCNWMWNSQSMKRSTNCHKFNIQKKKKYHPIYSVVFHQ